MQTETKKQLLWGLFALAFIVGGVSLMRWAATTSAELKSAQASQPPAFLAGTPAAFLHEYLDGDFRGDRLEGANWQRYKEMVIWPTEPNWETAYVIRSFRMQSGPNTAQEANFDVTYDTLGELNLHTFTYEPSPSRQTVPFLLVPRQDRWRVGTPMLKPHVSPQAAIAHLERMSVRNQQYRGNIDKAIARLKTEAPAAPGPSSGKP